MKNSILLLAVLAAGCRAVPVRYDYAKEPDPRRSEYVIGVSDGLAIQVWRNPELSRDVLVRPDGTITLPLLGDLQAGGKTPTELKTEIAKRLEKYIRDEGAVVTVAITRVNSYNFTVAGNVQNPGIFSEQRYVTVLEAMQLAGGPNRFASPQKTQLMRKDKSGKVRVIPIDYLALLEGKQPEANLALLPGDQLFVP